MAISKDSVKAKFELKFKKVNLTKNFKDSVINKIANKLDSEDDIDQTLDLYEDVISESAAEADRIRTQAKKDALKQPEKETLQEDELEPLPIDTPEYVKVLLKEVKALKEAQQNFEKAKQTETIVDRFKKDDRLKGIPEFVLKGYIPKNEEELEANIAEVTTQFSQFAQDNKLANIGQDAPNRANGGGTEINQKAIEAQLDNWVAGKLPVATKEN